MHDCCVLFVHHRDCPVTRRHLAVVRERNPQFPVVPLVCDDGDGSRPAAGGVEGAVEVRRTFDRGRNWHNLDLIYAQWFRGGGRVEARRYMVIEWDCLATAPLREWYEQVWDADAAGSWTPRVEVESDRRWWWFQTQWQFLPLAWQRHAAGVVPLNGLLLSRAALAALAAAPAVEGIFCELRLGTLLREAGFELSQLPPEKARLNVYLPHNQSVLVDPTTPGVYHPVKG